jgi:putative peptidoglycan lipid II flippase
LLTLRTPASYSKTIHLLLAATGLHVALTLAVFGAGRLQLFPASLSANGLSNTLGSDSLVPYKSEVESLAELLHKGEASAWFHSPVELHAKLYSLSFALFSQWTTFNVLTVEPLNLLYYLVILILIYGLARLVFDRRAGLLAAVTVALWPSFLLHTTQLLRDPLVIIVTLVLMLSAAQWLTRTSSWRQALPSVLGTVIAVATIWFVRASMWNIVPLILVLTLLLLVVRQLREKRVLLVNLLCVLLALVTVISSPRALSRSRLVLKQNVPPAAPAWQTAETAWQRIARLRRHESEDSLIVPGSYIDSDVRFGGFLDIVRYSPRAIMIGLFVPFPNMWFTPGQHVGMPARLMAGFETLLTYLIELLCVVGFWQRRQQFAVWLLLPTAVLGAGAVALVVVNVGSIYRLRYSFWMLLVVLGSGGLVRVFSKASKEKRAQPQLPHSP